MSTRSRGLRRRQGPPAPQHFGLVLSARRAAVYLGVSETTFHALRHEHEAFPAPVEMRSSLMYRREDLRAWVRGLRKREEKTP